MKRRTAQPTVEITIEQAFALSARVHRELGGYFKDTITTTTSDYDIAGYHTVF